MLDWLDHCGTVFDMHQAADVSPRKGIWQWIDGGGIARCACQPLDKAALRVTSQAVHMGFKDVNAATCTFTAHGLEVQNIIVAALYWALKPMGFKA